MTLKIDKHVPMPPRSKYPFADMEVGDSFFCKDASGEMLRSASAYHGKKLGAKFSALKEGDGYRVWRIE